MEAPISSESDEEFSDESLSLSQSDFAADDEEVDINIHFHCEHCFKLSKCEERPKPGWCCEIVECKNSCGMRFHLCKNEEHELMCTHARIHCINFGNGCPRIMPRYNLSDHLPVCPASVIVCNAEWNRWAFGARERERISYAKGVTTYYSTDDLDMSLAIDDQRLVNEMHSQSKYLRKVMCNGMNKRFPSLPLSVRGTLRNDVDANSDRKIARSNSTTDEDEEGLTPGLSLSVCTELLRGKKPPDNNVIENHAAADVSNLSINSDVPYTSMYKRRQSSKKSDDMTEFCCLHGILKDICLFCRNDPDEPDYKYGNVWREQIDFSNPGIMNWNKEPRLEKIRKRNPLGFYTYKRFDESDEEELAENGEDDDHNLPDKSHLNEDQGISAARRFRFKTPPPAPLTPKGLTVEIGLKHYSKHQVKPKAMFTFQCMQEFRRDEFCNHYQNVHSEIQEGLDGWVMQRCPLHIFGCSFSVKRLYPLKQDGDVVFCHSLRSFGIKPLPPHLNCKHYNNIHSRSPSVEKNHIKAVQNGLIAIPEHPSLPEDPNAQFMACSFHIMFLPFEVLQCIARHLDGFSLNNLSLTCHFMRAVCFSLLDEKGLVLQEWVKTSSDGKVSWKVGRNKWFFSKSFEFVQNWAFRKDEAMTNHLSKCPFNIRCLSNKKFCYSLLRKEDIKSIHLK